MPDRVYSGDQCDASAVSSLGGRATFSSISIWGSRQHFAKPIDWRQPRMLTVILLR